MKRILIVMSMAVLVSMLLSGCGLVKLAQTKDSDTCAMFVVNKTTYQEVGTALGKPNSVRMGLDGKTATYAAGYLLVKATYNTDGTLKDINCEKSE